MNTSTTDILLASDQREILVWRRIGGTNPGYGLDVDGETVAFVPQGLPDVRAAARVLAAVRGLTLITPQAAPIPITGSASRPPITPDQSQMLSRFYGAAESAWDEPMQPRRR